MADGAKLKSSASSPGSFPADPQPLATDRIHHDHDMVMACVQTTLVSPPRHFIENLTLSEKIK